MPNTLNGFSPRVVPRNLNAVDDGSPGVPLSSSQMAGGIVQPYIGQLGLLVAFDGNTAAKMSLTNTLFGGLYMYVQFKAASTASNARGQLVFWNDFENYIVTPDVTATTASLVAGVTLNAVTKGNYGFIQVAGKASIKFKASTTKATPAIGDLVIVDVTPSNTADVLADATALTSPTAKLMIGMAITAPVGGAISLVEMVSRCPFFV